MSEAPQPCVHCGVDVRRTRRFKDAAGQLFCTSCAEKLRARSAAPSFSAHASTPPSQPDGTIALADEPDSRPRRPIAKSPYADLELCPDCGVPFGSGPVCLSCGHDRRTGDSIGRNAPPPAGEPVSSKLQTPAKPPKPCMECGYDLRGLKTARCPECGTINPRHKLGQPSPKQALREMYLKPLAMIAVGVAIVVVVQFIAGSIVGTGAGATGSAGLGAKALVGAQAVLGYLILYPIVLVVGFVAYVICSMIFIGFDEPIGVTFVRLGAVYAITDAVESIIKPIPVIGFVAWLIAGIVYLGLLMELMELDLEDAWLVAAVTFFAKVIIALVAFTLISGLF